ncbi:MAG: NAD+ synthase [Cyanobium sp. PLM2.Bin73]|nr:MAG: NAD+ synthase [Cyanobium sp. PLM2.Bin73]
MRLALAQLNPVVGDLAGNAAGILEACRRAQDQGASLVLTPELSLWGYPPRDLLLLPARLQEQQRALDRLTRQLARECPGLGVLVGLAEPSGDAQLPNLHNAIALVQDGQWRVVARKQLLPSYDVFDERRYFRPATAPAVLELPWEGRSLRLGLTICEDLWVEEELLGQRLAGPDPVAALGGQGIDLLVNLSASPFGQGKLALRQQLAAQAARRLHCPVVYVNQVGGNDELVFDGASFVVDGSGAVVARMPCCAEALQLWPLAAGEAAPAARSLPPPQPLEQLLLALVLGVRDYARKCGFQRALLGLSGGIDSALVAVIAAAALGADQLLALLMPSPWSSEGSIHDAEALAQRLGLATHTVPISALMGGFDAALSPALGQPPEGLTAENLQSRIRGTLLMAMANQQGRLLLSTGNKSELAVGYCTLYGDMNGGLAVIGDLYKTTVFRLCSWLDNPDSRSCRNALGLPAEGELIGAAIRLKPPSAELQPNQRDSDSLPDYTLLDPVLKALVERRHSPEQLAAEGTDPQLAQRVMALLQRAEFKRRQAAPVLKVSSQAFGSGWRMPIAAV